MIKRVLWALTGTSAGCNQWVGELPPERLGRAYVFLNKSHRASTYLNRPYRKRSKWLSALSEYHDPPEDVATPGVVEMAPWPVGFDKDGVVQWDWDKCAMRGGSWKKVKERMQNRRIEPECVSTLLRIDPRLIPSSHSLVLFASGYKHEFSKWLSPEYPRAWDADVRDIVCSSTPDVAFIGFVRPGVGAIPPIAEMQSMWWTAYLKGWMKLPTDPPHYYLLASEIARIKVRCREFAHELLSLTRSARAARRRPLDVPIDSRARHVRLALSLVPPHDPRALRHPYLLLLRCLHLALPSRRALQVRLCAESRQDRDLGHGQEARVDRQHLHGRDSDGFLCACQRAFARCIVFELG